MAALASITTSPRLAGKFGFQSVFGAAPVKAAVVAPPTSAPPSVPPPGGFKSSIQLEDAQGLTFKSWGDPHETTGDGLKFDNMGVGYFTALKSASGDLMVTKRHESIPGTGADGSTVNTEAAVKAGEDVVKYNTKDNKLHINDAEVNLKDGETINLPDGGKVTKNGNKITVTSPRGDEITFVDQGKYMDLEGKISPSRKDGEVTGSLGRFDADTDASNDLVKRDGTLAKDVNEFINDWKTPDAENMLTQPAAKFNSPEAKEIAALQKENAELFKQEQAASEERRPLLDEIARNQAAYDALKGLPPEQRSEADDAFVKKFDATKAKVDALSNKIADLNVKQDQNRERIAALKEIIKLKGEAALLYTTEQDLSNERRPLLGEIAALKAQFDFLSSLPKEQRSEADEEFLKRYQKILDEIAQLNKRIADLNDEQKRIEERLRELDKIAHPGAAPVAKAA